MDLCTMFKVSQTSTSAGMAGVAESKPRSDEFLSELTELLRSALL